MTLLDWEDSDLYEELTSKFIMVVFRRDPSGSDYILDNVKFWNMPQKDIDVCEEVWEKTKYLVMYGDYNHFPKESENPIIHVRPKGKNSEDLMATPQGGMDLLHEYGFKTVAMALRNDSVRIDDEKLHAEEKLAIILGTEGDGLAAETMADCDYTVKIPMSHGVDSLNVAAASAVAFWEFGK